VLETESFGKNRAGTTSMEEKKAGKKEGKPKRRESISRSANLVW